MLQVVLLLQLITITNHCIVNTLYKEPRYKEITKQLCYC